MREIVLGGKDVSVWHDRNKSNDKEPAGRNRIVSAEFMLFNDRVVLYIAQSASPDYLYDPETDEYMYLYCFDQDEQRRQVLVRNYTFSTAESRLLDEWLTKLVE